MSQKLSNIGDIPTWTLDPPSPKELMLIRSSILFGHASVSVGTFRQAFLNGTGMCQYNNRNLENGALTFRVGCIKLDVWNNCAPLK